MSDPSDPRQAARNAAEARLRGDPPPGSPIPTTIKVVKPWTPPTEVEDNKTRKEFYRLLDRGIVRDNGYRQAAECCQTLLKISTNIIEHMDEPKFRTLKATNKMVKDKILDAKGGHDYLIALGFRTSTVDFSTRYTLDNTPQRSHTLRLGTDVLIDRLPALNERLSHIHQSSSQTKKKEEQERAAAAIRNAEADRLIVKERVAREKLAREARAQKQREEGPSTSGPGHAPTYHADIDDEDEDEEGDDDEDDEEQNGHPGGGHRLGGA